MSCSDVFNLSKHWSRWGWCESSWGKSVGRNSGRAIDLFYKYKSCCWVGVDMTLIVKYWSSSLIIFNLSSQKANCHQYFSSLVVCLFEVHEAFFLSPAEWLTNSGCCRCWGRSATSVSPACSLTAPISPDGPARRHLLCPGWAPGSPRMLCTCFYWSEGNSRTPELSREQWGARYSISVPVQVSVSTSTLPFIRYDMTINRISGHNLWKGNPILLMDRTVGIHFHEYFNISLKSIEIKLNTSPG